MCPFCLPVISTLFLQLVHPRIRKSSVNADLVELEHSLAKLALSQDATQAAFRERDYYYWNQDFSLQDAQSQPQYPIRLFFVMADRADRLP